jgi:probable HAF family extracellular repeat protein
MKTIVKLAVILSLASLAGSLTLRAAARAVILSGGSWVDLGTLGSDPGAIAVAINNSGQVTGTSADPTAFLYSGGSMSSLGAANTRADSINSSGEIVGTYSYYTTPGAFVYNGSSISNLPTLGGAAVHAYGINDSGIIVGCTTQQPGHAFSYNGTTMTDLGVLATGQPACAYSINASGVIAGIAFTSVVAHFFQYSGGVMTDLGAPSFIQGAYGNGQSAFVGGINSAGVIVGCAIDETVSTRPTRSVYYNGSWNTIPMLSGDSQSCALGINSSGVIVGWGYPSGHPWQYAGGTLTDLGVAPSWTGVSASRRYSRNSHAVSRATRAA